MSFKNVRATDVKRNPRVVLPKPRHQREESEMATRDTLIGQEYKKYISENPDPLRTVTESEARGIKKLQKRVASGLITICQTDKSGGLCILSREDWEQIGESHTSGDREINWDKVEQDMRLMKGHIRCVNHILRPGSNSGNEERVWAAKELMSTIIPVMYPQIKDWITGKHPDGVTVSQDQM